MASKNLTFDVIAKDNASKTFAKVGGAAERSGKGFTSAGSGLKKLVGVFAGLAVVSKATDFLKDSVAEARESQKVGAQTTAVLKSTGHAANISANQVGNLATAISNKVGIDDEAIQSGENMLLTFKNVRNEVGEGNDIFNQATKVVTDLSVGMKVPLKNAAVMAGKALNDPVKGISALSRVGVTFDKGQVKTIKHLVATGHTMKAQKIILRELNSEFKGSAAAQATPAEKAQVAWGNLKETIGGKLLPILDRLESWFSKKAAPALQKFFGQMQSGVGTGGKVADALQRVGDVLGTVFGFINDNKTAVAGFLGTLVAISAATKVYAAVSRGLAMIQAVQAVAAGSATEAQIGLNAAMRANVIGIIVTLLAAAVGGLIYAYKHSEKFRTICNAAFHGVAKAASFMWNNVLKPVFKFLISTWLMVAGAIVHGAAKAFGWVPGIGPKLKTAARKFDDFRDHVNNVLDGVHPAKIRVRDYATPTLRSVQRMLAGIRDKSITLTVFANTSHATAVRNQLADFHHAGGGQVFRGRRYTVGEDGPEQFVAPANGRIISNRDAFRPGGSGAGGGDLGTFALDLRLDGKTMQRVLLKLKRTNGGVSLGLA